MARTRRCGVALPIETARLVLRDFVSADRAAFASFSGDPRILRHVLHEVVDTDALGQRFDRLRARQHAEPRRCWELAVVARRTGQVIGSCELTLRGRREADLGYLLARRGARYGA